MKNNYIVIQSWMCSDLNLKGNDLLIYALIYGFSQDGESVFNGSRSYIAETLNISLPTVDKALNNLISSNLIEKISNTVNNVTFNSYRVLKNFIGSKESLLPLKNLDPINNNINNNINNKDNIKNNKNNKSEDCDTLFQFGETEKQKKPNLYTKCVAVINSWTNIREIEELLTQYLKMCLEGGWLQYVNQWRGMLKKLEQVQMKCHPHTFEEIIQNSINHGWKSFYPITDYNNTQTSYKENFTSPKHEGEYKPVCDENGKPLVF